MQNCKTPLEKEAWIFFNSHRCNTVLNLYNKQIDLDFWKVVQDQIVNNPWVIPIKTIYLKESNITPNDMIPELLPIAQFQ